ncbi:putative nuclease HARBI1 isoform X1 [Linepithema humile]|uniref:putative nuclease HARBI1 isoform X1 n=1 Tax=Linepithema humile TaxID=83485 RepID=UPI00351F30B8
MDENTIMDPNIILIIIWKKWQKWKKMKQTLQQRKVEKRHIFKLFLIWKLMMHQEEKVHHKMWVRPIFRERQRLLQGASNNLVREMEFGDHEMFFNYCRMSVDMFDQLLNVIGPLIEKQFVIRDPICPRTRLLVCLCYLASGDSMTSIAYSFRIGITTVSKIITETCEELWNTLHKSVFPEIKKENWLRIANDFATKWHFPHCIGAIDGKHVIIQSPPHSGSTFYNYKGSHSINLLAVCDANYCFTLVDIGGEGRQSDGGIFTHSNFGQRFQQNQMTLPQPRPIESSGPALPFILVADEAFALTHYMMRPYPRSGRLNCQRKVFNYRLSRARRMIESVFGILAAKWRIYRRPIIASVSIAVKIVQATVCLHNFVIQNENKLPLSERRYSRILSEVELRTSGALQEINNANRTNTHTRLASRIRDDFATYFENNGAVPWQWKKVLLNDF